MRAEPQGIDLEAEIRRAKKRNTAIAEKVVFRFLMDKKKIRETQANKAIQKENEFDVRLRSVSEFMSLWNRWRAFYLGLGSIQPKTSSQLTAIENAIDIANANSFKLTVFIAAIHREFKRRNVNPGFHDLVRFGEEHYHKHFNGVIADLDDVSYQEEALDGGSV